MSKTSIAPPSLPSFPFALTSFYDHLDRDTEGYAGDMFRLASQAWSAENGYGFHLWQDWARAYGELIMAPYAAMARLWLDPPAAPPPGSTPPQA